jgi:hypothetical protein
MSEEERKEKRRLYEIEYRKKNIEKKKEQNKLYYQSTKEKRKNYYEENKNKIIKQNKKYREENKDKISKTKKKYREENKNEINKYFRDRRKNDIIFKISSNLRSNISLSIKKLNKNKKSKTELILGCSFEEFKLYLESKFESWMTWDNYGLYNGELNYGWDIDHIKPVSSAKTISELIGLNHYTNLQPLCSKVNRDIKKGG